MDRFHSDILSQLEAKGMPSDSIRKIWEEKVSSDFCLYYSGPDETARHIQHFHGHPPFLPIFEYFEDLIVLDIESGTLVEIYHDGSPSRVIGRTYQQLLSYIFVGLGYAMLSDVVEEVAEDLGYKYLDEFRKFMDTDSELTGSQAQMAFVATTL